jgi:hypothetical protein
LTFTVPVKSSPSCPVRVAPATPPTPAEAARSAPAVEPPHEAEAIDLLAVSGVGGAVRRALPYVVTAAASFCVVLGVIWWIRRR